ncbi:MAG: EpsG family protein, partial [Brevinematia bacterium]
MILIIDKVYKKLLLSQIIAWTIVICTPFLFLNSFGVEIRQVLSIALLLYGFTFFHLEGSVKKFLFFAILASSSHFSSIFASLLILTIYLLIGRIKEKNMNIAIIMVM